MSSELLWVFVWLSRGHTTLTSRELISCEEAHTYIVMLLYLMWAEYTQLVVYLVRKKEWSVAAQIVRRIIYTCK
jgi:hypothetical protein